MSIDSFSQSRAALVCPDSGKDLYPLGLSLTKPEHDIKWEGADCKYFARWERHENFRVHVKWCTPYV